MLTSDVTVISDVFPEKVHITCEARKKVNKHRPNIQKIKSYEKLERDVAFKSWRGSKGNPANYKGARVMKAQTKELHKQTHFNHMSSLMGKVVPPDRLPSPKPLKR